MSTGQKLFLLRESGVLKLTEGQFREEMMYHMIVGDIVQEEPALPAQEVPVDGGSCTALVVPFLSTIMWQERIGVMQIGDHDEPMGDFEPRKSVVFDHFGSSILCTRPFDSPEHRQKTKIRQNHLITLTLGEKD